MRVVHLPDFCDFSSTKSRKKASRSEQQTDGPTDRWTHSLKEMRWLHLEMNSFFGHLSQIQARIRFQRKPLKRKKTGETLR